MLWAPIRDTHVPSLRSEDAVCEVGPPKCGSSRAGSQIPALNSERLEDKLQSEFHRPRIGLDVGNPPESTAGLVNQVSCPVSIWWEAIVGIGKPRILMVERIENFPPEVKVLAFTNM